MSEEKGTEAKEETTRDLATVQEELKIAKASHSEAKAAARKFKRANSIRNADAIKDEKVKEEFEALTELVTEAQEAIDALAEEAKALKPKGGQGGGAKYGYVKIKDAETGEDRDLTKEEKKKWRTHARKQAKKDGITPEQVPFDEGLYKPKVKKEKPAKKDKEAAKETPEAGKEPADLPPGEASKKAHKAEDEENAEKQSKKSRRRAKTAE